MSMLSSQHVNQVNVNQLGVVGPLTSTGQATLGSLNLGAPVTHTESFTVGPTENWLVCNPVNATIVVTLPDAATSKGRILFFKSFTNLPHEVVSASNDVVSFNTGTVGTVITYPAYTDWVVLVSDGTYWVTQMVY